MASLRENHDLALDTDFKLRTIMALNAVAVTRLLATDPTSTDYAKEVQAIRAVLSLSVNSVLAVTRMLASQGLSNESTDTALTAALTNVWTNFRNLFDGTVPNPPFGV